MSKSLFKFIKFDSNEHKQWFEEIINSSSLYMCNYKDQADVNDENEGHYYVSADTNRKMLEKIANAKLTILICSLSHEFQNTHLWNAFADNGSGACISVDVIDENVDVKKIQYVDELPYYPNSYFLNKEATKIAKDVIIHKLERFEEERETRVMKCNDGTDLRLKVKIKRIYLGWNMPEEDIIKYRRLLQEKNIPVTVLHKEVKDKNR